MREIAREVREPIALGPGRLKEMKPAALLVRFAFGASIALVAGLVGMRFGPLVGGLFLAFPAVLPASLTLLEKKDGRAQADVDALGAILGAFGMVAFALVAFLALTRLSGAVAVPLAWGAWIAVSMVLFLVVRALLLGRGSKA